MGQRLSYFRLADQPPDPLPVASETLEYRCKTLFKQGLDLETRWWSPDPTNRPDATTYLDYLDTFTEAVLALAKLSPNNHELAIYANQIIRHEGYFSDLRPEKHAPVNLFRLLMTLISVPDGKNQDRFDWYQVGNNIYCAFMPLDSADDIDKFCFGARRVIGAHDSIADAVHKSNFARGFLDRFIGHLRSRIRNLSKNQASHAIIGRYFELWHLAFERLPHLYHGDQRPGLTLAELQARHRREIDEILLDTQ